MNLGCGHHVVAGWINADRAPGPGVDLCCDLTRGLPLPSGRLDCVVAIHLLQDLPFPALPPALRELRRVLRPEGVLRLAVPDLERAIHAWLDDDRGYFYIGDEEVTSIGGKLCVQAVWYGSVRTPFTYDFAAELLDRAGFRAVTRCGFRRTASPWPDIAELDNRERESLFIEAIR